MWSMCARVSNVRNNDPSLIEAVELTTNVDVQSDFEPQNFGERESGYVILNRSSEGPTTVGKEMAETEAPLPQVPGHSADPELAAAWTKTARWDIPGYARTVRLEAGLYALILGKSDAQVEDFDGIILPRTQIIPRIDDQAVISIVPGSPGDQGWLGPDGGTVVLQVSEPGGFIDAATYGITAEAALPTIKLLDFNRLRDGLASSATVGPHPQGREIQSELILHIERQGDRRFATGGWAGNPGGRLRVEGFAIHPLEAVAPGHIEYMAFGLGGRQTPWVSDARL